ncbi:hypothetical protein [Bombilactobacillus bombi]|uniref:hypothetical protein n=1 Tax=Bombilactobacillus bombi TaxID=1303590 RepID=UPI002159D4F4|nr:hypothetical protein [Bombilactobacillus bombi]
MPDLCLALLQQDLEYLLQQQLADWQQMVEFSINFIEHHRVRCLNFYHLLILQNQEIISQDTITKLLELYLAQTLQSQFNYQLLKKHSVEIKFVVGGILYQLKKWFDSQLKLAAVDVIESMNCGLSLLEDTLIMEH